MWRHLIPRFEAGGWAGAALTSRPACPKHDVTPPWRTTVRDDVEGGIFCIQWLGVMIEIGMGRVR